MLSHTLQVMLLWRLADFIDELVSGSLKMSLGKYMLVGLDALVVQSLIISILLLLAYSLNKWLASSEPLP